MVGFKCCGTKWYDAELKSLRSDAVLAGSTVSADTDRQVMLSKCHRHRAYKQSKKRKTKKVLLAHILFCLHKIIDMLLNLIYKVLN